MELFELSILVDSNASMHWARLKLVLLLMEFVEEPRCCNCGGVGKPEEEDNSLTEERLRETSDVFVGEGGDTKDGVEWGSRLFSRVAIVWHLQVCNAYGGEGRFDKQNITLVYYFYKFRIHSSYS